MSRTGCRRSRSSACPVRRSPRRASEVLCAMENAAEAAAAGAIAIGVASLREAAAHLSGEARRAPAEVPPPAPPPRVAVDLADISGHETPKRALEIAAAGGHSLLL